jgi:signal transduction histidine kinase
MEAAESEASKNMARGNSGLNVALLACLTAAVCYCAAELGGFLIIREPQTLWPLWPGCAVLTAILLVIPRKNWALVLAAGLAGFVVYDLQVGVAIGSIAWLILTDLLEILVAAWGVHWALGCVPHLNSLKALAKYSFFTVFLASVIVSTVGMYGLDGNRWISWRVIFLSEGLAFLTVAPAMLGWIGEAERWARATWAQVFEGCVLMVALISLSYVMFVARAGSYPPALLYSLLPLLLWSALRFGTTGVGTAATTVALLSIWGALHGHGPFMEKDPIDRVLSLQLFLWFAVIPFMILAAQVEEHRRAEKELRGVSLKLIEAQEQERARIARELHDDLSQRMALLGIGLTQFERSMPELSSDAQERLQKISEVAGEVSSELHSMSHQLHPAKLDLLGLVATVGGHCREVSQQHELRVEFVHRDMDERIRKDVALCLFRIVQEALRNIVKHGHTEDAKVELSGGGGEIHLCISDEGAGFNPESAQAKGGLGLISMRERLRLVGGHLDVESEPSQGTRIYVRVPVSDVGVQKKNGTKAFKANA